ncbi:MAG: endonuclease III [Clostridia bacterium]|nr:endonuclease III [Clostridia bacterium]
MVKNEVFVGYLENLFKDAKCELEFNNNFELLIAVMLSAQCTDKRVNIVTKSLFKQLKTPEDFVNLPLEALEERIKSCGLYKSKAKHIKECCESLINIFNGEVPNTMDSLTSLSGVGRKTANVVLATAFNQNCIAVDTHVLRVSNRLGFTKSQNPNVCEKDLVKKFKHNLNKLHYRMVLFGRYYCKAQKPLCETCQLKNECLHYKKVLSNKG